MCAPPVASFSVKDSSGFDLIKVSKTYKIVSITLSQEGPYIFLFFFIVGSKSDRKILFDLGIGYLNGAATGPF